LDSLLIKKIADEVIRQLEGKAEPEVSREETLVVIASQIVGDEAAMAALREKFSGKLLLAAMGRTFTAADERTEFIVDDGIKNLLTLAAQSDNVVLMAPGIHQLENIAYGQEGGQPEEVLLRSILWGKKAQVLLDFTPPRFKRGTFYEKIGDALDALNDMGVETFTYSCIRPVNPEALSLVTENEVTQAFETGKFEIKCERGAIITPSARDKAREMNIKIDWQG
jgi:hypothetical protein